MVHVMSKKIKLYDTGDCVEVTVWEGYDKNGFLENVQRIALVLEAVYVEMDDANPAHEGEDGHEWMYRVSLADGRVEEVWDYEIKPVNVMGKDYNTISHKPKGA